MRLDVVHHSMDASPNRTNTRLACIAKDRSRVRRASGSSGGALRFPSRPRRTACLALAGGTFKSTRCGPRQTKAHHEPRGTRGEGSRPHGSIQRWRLCVRYHAARIEPPRSCGERGFAVPGLIDEWPAFFAFVTSFVSVLIMWMNHHNMFNYIRKIDRRLMLMNG